MNDNRKRKREEEQEIYYQHQSQQNVQILSTNNGGLDVNSPFILNQLPVLQNQQLVYQIPQVQGSTQGNNTSENTYYVFIPVSETDGQPEKEETEVKTGQYVTYRTVGNEAKTTTNSVITIDGIKQSKDYDLSQPTKIDHHQQHHIQRPQEVYILDKQPYQHHQEQMPPSCQVTQSQGTVIAQAHSNSKWKNLYRCEHTGCEEKFSSLHEKKLHLENHLFPESDVFKCNLCDLVFKKAVERNKHIETHAVVSTHKCKHCQKCFPYYTTLVAHVEEAFSTEQFHCFFCGRGFDDTTTFLRHNSWSMKSCKCGTQICGDMVYQKHLNQCSEGGGAKGK